MKSTPLLFSLLLLAAYALAGTPSVAEQDPQSANAIMPGCRIPSGSGITESFLAHGATRRGAWR
jgi:hypothetical protein